MRFLITLFAGSLLASQGLSQTSIVSLEIPEDSCDDGCHPLNDDVWRVATPPFPLDVGTGIGNYVADEDPSEVQNNIFTLHDHVYVSLHVPDPSRAVVTYEFDLPTVVSQVEIIQHINGITNVEGFIGDSLASLVSIGSTFGPKGDVEGPNLLVNGESNVFDFGNTTAGMFFRFVIRKTNHQAGHASFRAYPLDQNGNRIPEAVDCNGNTVADTSDVALGTSHDNNGNGIPDECESTNYCTGGTSASGCSAVVSATGIPSAIASSGFSLAVSGVEGAKDGMFFFGANGRQAVTWGTGYQCVVPPVKRGGLLAGIGTANACDGMFTQDLNAYWCPTCPKPLHNPGAGAVVQAQFWYRDPWNTATTKTTTLSDAIEFTVGP